ncbi:MULTISPECIES: hypothetical protein [unclassified Massilia]|uniref:hypothetical protein n=1 Tax=unclassified Massilia TaxID=2609279 RepID=UPI000A44C253|nr:MULTISPECIES: hypothetical protein [unclassified Massilia]
MKVLKIAAIILVAVASVGLSLETALAGAAGSFGKSCGGFKPETRTTCWRNLL